MRRLVFLLTLFSVSLLLLIACHRRPQTIIAIKTYETPGEILGEEEILSTHEIDPHHLGFVLYDREHNRVVKVHNADQLFIPASVTKIIITLAALKVLGADYRFKTSLAYSGSIKDGLLLGDLFLRGGGDPTLTAADLMVMVEKLKENGIQKVVGNLFFDDSLFAGQEAIDTQFGNDTAYNPGLGALSLDSNRFYIAWSKTDKRGTMEVFSIPQLPSLRLGLAADVEPEHGNFLYERNAAFDRWLLLPTVQKDGSERLPVKRPGSFTAELFADFGRMRGISLPSPRPTTDAGNTLPIYTIESKPLLNIVAEILKSSNNLMAELVLLATAKKLRNDVSGLPEAAHTVRHWLAKKIPTVDWSGFHLENGSGLTVSNRISPNQMLEILKFADRDLKLDRSYLSLLPIAGWKGSLKRRMKTPEVAFHVWAKTGTIYYASALAGSLYSGSHRELLFVLFMTDIERRTRYDASTMAQKKDLDQDATAWIKRARKTQDQLLANWILSY